MNPMRLRNLQIYTNAKNDHEIVESLLQLNNKKSLLNDEEAAQKCLLDTYRKRHGEGEMLKLIHDLTNKNREIRKKQINKTYQAEKLSRIISSGHTYLNYNQLKRLLLGKGFLSLFCLGSSQMNKTNSHFFKFKSYSSPGSNISLEVKTDNVNRRVKQVINIPTGDFYKTEK